MTVASVREELTPAQPEPQGKTVYANNVGTLTWVDAGNFQIKFLENVDWTLELNINV